LIIKIEDFFSISLDLLKFINPMQLEVGLEGSRLNGLLLLAMILIGISIYKYLREHLLSFPFIDETSSHIFTFLFIFMAISSMPQNETLQPISILFIVLFRLFDGYGLGEFFNFSNRSITPYIVGLVFAVFYGYLLYEIYSISEIKTFTFLPYILSFIFEAMALVGVSKIIFSFKLEYFSALLLSIAFCMIVLSGFIGTYEYSNKFEVLLFYLAFPLGVLIRLSLGKKKIL